MADLHDPFPACDVCGRTILKGEQIHEYLTEQRQVIRVCVLCRSRAEASGWIPASMAPALATDEPKRSRGLALRQRLSRAAARARAGAKARGRTEPQPAADEPPEPPARWAGADAGPQEATPEPARPPQEAAAEAAGEPEAPAQREVPAAEPGDAGEAPAAEPEPQPEPQSPRRQARPRAKRPARTRSAKPEAKGEGTRRRRRSSAKRGPEALMRRAVERFNSSEERRKVAGLMRSLGEPQAGVRPDPRRQLAVVTVGWELSWYQWEVGADGDGDDDEPVREVAKGSELSELAEDARDWNAAVGEDGALRLRSAAERKQQAATEA